jgi:D-alanyl-lipoteichoic acid acyltransferase DltB (MBOAT superfamily)
MWNFNLPYAATNITDFWRRWHISLSTWLRDYLYIALGGNRRGNARTYANLLITMLLGGLWHGAAWNYVLWGAWHGIGLASHRIVAGRRKRTQTNAGAGELPELQDTTGKVQNLGVWNWRQLPSWAFTMCFVGYGWLLFRARSVEQIAAMTQALVDLSSPIWITSYLVNLAVFALPLVLMEVWQSRTRNLLAPLTLGLWPRAVLQGGLLLAIILFWERAEVPFIYFQF